MYLKYIEQINKVIFKTIYYEGLDVLGCCNYYDIHDIYVRLKRRTPTQSRNIDFNGLCSLPVKLFSKENRSFKKINITIFQDILTLLLLVGWIMDRGW